MIQISIKLVNFESVTAMTESMECVYKLSSLLPLHENSAHFLRFQDIRPFHDVAGNPVRVICRIVTVMDADHKSASSYVKREEGKNSGISSNCSVFEI